MRQILEARFDFGPEHHGGRYSNRPSLKLVLDRKFDHEACRWEQKGKYFYAEQDGFYHFLAHSGEDKNLGGFGGRVWDIVMKDGTPRALAGPWSGNSANFFKETGILTVEFDFTAKDDEYYHNGDRPLYYFGWAATKERIIEALKLVPPFDGLFKPKVVIGPDGHADFVWGKSDNYYIPSKLPV